MAEGLVLEFAGQGADTYEAVNGLLGLNATDGSGDWPAGLLFHAGGLTDDGLLVIEVWDSRDSQAAFMESRLGPALYEAGIDGPPSRVTWGSLHGVQNLGL